jgi:hypothetical protein
MTNEDKKIVADYMGYLTHPMGSWYDAPVYFAAGKAGNINFDLNDAGLVVKEMQKRDDWMSFITFADNEHFDKEISVEFSAWFYDADNFFKTFVEWRKGK